MSTTNWKAIRDVEWLNLVLGKQRENLKLLTLKIMR